MNSRKFHEIWIEQCNAAHDMKARYGADAAFRYLVAEKLLNFVDAAIGRPEFARELPRFVAHIRGLFTLQEIRTNLHGLNASRLNPLPIMAMTGTVTSS